MCIYDQGLADRIQASTAKKYADVSESMPPPPPICEGGGEPAIDDSYDEAKRIWDAIVSSSS